jgi:hypothetical protein
MSRQHPQDDRLPPVTVDVAQRHFAPGQIPGLTARKSAPEGRLLSHCRRNRPAADFVH